MEMDEVLVEELIPPGLVERVALSSMIPVEGYRPEMCRGCDNFVPGHWVGDEWEAGDCRYGLLEDHRCPNGGNVVMP